MIPDAGKPETRVALVTGGARRIGRVIVEQLHQQGWMVAIHANGSIEQAQQLATELNEQRQKSAVALSADLLDLSKTRDLIKAVKQVFGGLDLLVNNASTFYPTPVGEFSEDAWQDLLGSNLKGPMFLSEAAVPLLSERLGSIVNLLDTNLGRGMAAHPIYSAAKAGLAQLTRSLAASQAPNIRVNAVAPGVILWPEHETNPSAQAKQLERIPLQCKGDPKDIAAAVLYLASATYVTGQTIAVDGGLNLV